VARPAARARLGLRPARRNPVGRRARRPPAHEAAHSRTPDRNRHRPGLPVHRLTPFRRARLGSRVTAEEACDGRPRTDVQVPYALSAPVPLLRAPGAPDQPAETNSARLPGSEPPHRVDADRRARAADARPPLARPGAHRAGPGDPARRAAADAAAAAARPASVHRHADASSDGRAAVRQRRRAPGSGARSRGWKMRVAEGNQDAGQELAAGLVEGVDLFLDRPHDLGREEPPEIPGAARRKRVEIDPADGPFLNAIGWRDQTSLAANSPIPGSCPTSAIRVFLACLARSDVMAAKPPPGDSDSIVTIGGRGFTPAARMSAVCLART